MYSNQIIFQRPSSIANNRSSNSETSLPHHSNSTNHQISLSMGRPAQEKPSRFSISSPSSRLSPRLKTFHLSPFILTANSSVSPIPNIVSCLNSSRHLAVRFPPQDCPH